MPPPLFVHMVGCRLYYRSGDPAVTAHQLFAGKPMAVYRGPGWKGMVSINAFTEDITLRFSTVPRLPRFPFAAVQAP